MKAQTMNIKPVPNPCADVRKTRKAQGMNQTQFWRPLGVTQSGGSRYESGRDLPKPVAIVLTLKFGSAKDKARVVKEVGLQ